MLYRNWIAPRVWAWVGLCACLLEAGCTSEAGSHPADYATCAADEPSVLIHDDSILGGPGSPGPQLVVAAWDDGRIVWRHEDRLIQGTYDASQLRELLESLCEGSLLPEGMTLWRKVGPDNPYTSVRVRLAGRTVQLESDHERLAAFRGELMTMSGMTLGHAGSAGVRPRSRTQEEHEFLTAWAYVRGTVESWIPTSGAPFTGTVRWGRLELAADAGSPLRGRLAPLTPQNWK